MGPQTRPSPRTTFGPFEFDPASGDLRKHGNRIRLQGQPLQILGALLDRPGEVVSREELRRQLWGDDTHVDFEQGLNAAVNKLRQTLGDSAGEARFIETLPSRGYRFIAPVDRPATRAVLEIAAPPPRTPAPATGSRRWLAWGGGVALALMIPAAYWLGASGTSRTAEPVLARLRFAPPPGFALEGAASRQSFALSPDGARLAYTAVDASGAMSAFVQDLDSIEPRLIPGSRGVHTIFWPAASQSLYMVARGVLRRVTMDGPGEVVLGDSPPFLLSGAWTGPDQLILSSRLVSYRISSSTGGLERLESPYLWPQLLADGDHLLYVSWDASTRNFGAHIRRLADGVTSSLLVRADSRVQYTQSIRNPGTGYLVYLRSGNLLAHPFDPRSQRTIAEAFPVAQRVYSFFPTGASDFSVSERGTIAYSSYTGRSQLIWVDRQGKQVASIGPRASNVKSGSLSPDGRRLAAAYYDVERGAQDLWLFDTGTGAGRRLSPDPGLSDAAVWSPDSKRIAFLDTDGGRWPSVAVRGLDENSVQRVFPSGAFQIPTDWSPDGRFIAFANTGYPRVANETQSDVLLLDLDRDGKVLPLLNTRFHETNAVFSPDGQWLAFVTNESGQPELYVQPFQGGDAPAVKGERVLVSRNGAQAIRWRRDGKELFYLAFDGRIHAVPVDLSAGPRIGAAVPLFDISTEARAAIHAFNGFDVSADGQRFVIPTVTASVDGPAIVVIRNWESAVRR